MLKRLKTLFQENIYTGFSNELPPFTTSIVMSQSVIPKSARVFDTGFHVSDVFCLIKQLLVAIMAYLDSHHHNLPIQDNWFLPFSVPLTLGHIYSFLSSKPAWLHKGYAAWAKLSGLRRVPPQNRRTTVFAAQQRHHLLPMFTKSSTSKAHSN